MLLRTLPTPLLRTLKKTLTRCIKLAYMQKHGSPCPPYLSKIRDQSILPRILQVNAREALLSEAGFENVFRTQNWARRRKLFCR